MGMDAYSPSTGLDCSNFSESFHQEQPVASQQPQLNNSCRHEAFSSELHVFNMQEPQCNNSCRHDAMSSEIHALLHDWRRGWAASTAAQANAHVMMENLKLG